VLLYATARLSARPSAPACGATTWSTTSSSSTTRWRSAETACSSEVDIVLYDVTAGGPLAAVRS